MVIRRSADRSQGSRLLLSWVVALLHEENGSFGISFPDFPGAVSGGSSQDEAISRGQETLAFHVAGMIEDGDPLPPLRSIAELSSDVDFREASQGAAIVLIGLDLPGKAQRINISIDENLLERVDRAASKSHQSRSAFLASAAKELLKRSADG